MRKLLTFITMVCMATMICGCSFGSIPGLGSFFGSKGRQSPMPEPEIKVLTKSDSVDIDVYLDGTFSMAGYVNFPTNTVYTNAVRQIERTASSTWKKDNVEYIRFGDQFQRLTREEYLQFDRVSFYQQKDTSLQFVVDKMDEKKMNILVTDLFQTDQDIESLMASLKQKSFAAPDKALAIIGLRSQFNGKIYDIGKNKMYFDYATTDPDSYRPVYLLVMGLEDDVKEFSKQYQKDMGKGTRIVVFSKNLGENNKLEQGDTTRTKEDRNDKAATMAALNTMVKNPDVMQFRLKLKEKMSKSNLEMESDTIIGFCPEEYGLELLSLDRWDKGAFHKVEAKDFLTMRQNEFKRDKDEAEVKFTLRVDPLAIEKQPGQYRAQIALIPSKSAYLECAKLFDDWNFVDSQVTAETLHLFGNRTLNVSNFLKMIGNINYEVNAPGFYDLPIYFDAIK